MAYIFLSNVVKEFRLYNNPTDLLRELIALHGQHFYRRRLALENISFHLAAGEVLGIIGLNGSGKSTLLRLLAKIYRPTQGEVEIEGRVLSLQTLHAGLNLELDCTANLHRKGLLYGMPPARVDEFMEDILAYAGLNEYLRIPLKYYSAGMVLRLALALVLCIDADIYLFDEALSVGDAAFQRKTMVKLRELKSRGKIIVMVSHSISDLATIADKVLLLQSGRVLQLGSPEDVLATYLQRCEKEAQQLVLDQNPSGSFIGENYPTHDLIITLLQVLDREGRPAETIRTGDPLVVRITYRVERPVERPLLRLQLHRNDGLWVWGHNNYRSAFELEGRSGTHTVEVTLPTINLLASTYYFSVGLWSDEYQSLASKRPCDLRCHDRALRVESHREQGAGVVVLPLTWSRTEA